MNIRAAFAKLTQRKLSLFTQQGLGRELEDAIQSDNAFSIVTCAETRLGMFKEDDLQGRPYLALLASVSPDSFYALLDASPALFEVRDKHCRTVLHYLGDLGKAQIMNDIIRQLPHTADVEDDKSEKPLDALSRGLNRRVEETRKITLLQHLSKS